MLSLTSRLPRTPATITLAALLASSLVLRLALCFRRIPWLLDRFLTDDAFYYYSVARHIVAGHGSTADGVSVSNGYHPLWLLLGLPFFALSGENRDLPVHLMLCSQALLDVLAGYLVYRLLVKVGASPWAAVLGSLLYLAPVGSIIESLNGLETSLATAGLLGLTLLWLRLGERPGRLTHWAGFGAFLGLCMLARTDLGLVAPFLAAAVVVKGRRELQTALLRLVAMAGAALLVTAPWFAWSLLRTGHLVQTSGLADPLVYHRQIEAWGYSSLPLWVWWSRSLQCLGEAWTFIAWHLASGPLLAALGLALVACWLFRERAALRPLLRQLRGLWPILAVAAAVILIDALVRWYPRRWHMTPASLWLALGAPLASQAVLGLASRRRLTALGLALLLLVPLVGGHVEVWGKIARSQPPFQRSGALESLADLERIHPPGAVIGHSDCGIMSYYARKISVVNLDGVINAEAYDALRARDLMSYIRRRKIDAFWLRDGLIYPELTGVGFFEQNDFSAAHIRPLSNERRGSPLTDDVLAVDRLQGYRYFRGGLETNPRGASEGTFTLGRVARLGFDLPQGSRPEDFVGLELVAFSVLDPEQRVSVHVNGVEAASLTLSRDQARKSHSFALRPGLLRARANSLALVFPSVSSPAARGLSRDVRQIGARLVSFQLLRRPIETWLPPPDSRFKLEASGIGPARWLNGQWSHPVIGQVAELKAGLRAGRFRFLVLHVAPTLLSDPPQAVRARLNGVDLGRQALGAEPRIYVFPLPAGSHRAGTNHLRLSFEQAVPLSHEPGSPGVAALLGLVAFGP